MASLDDEPATGSACAALGTADKPLLRFDAAIPVRGEACATYNAKLIYEAFNSGTAKSGAGGTRPAARVASAPRTPRRPARDSQRSGPSRRPVAPGASFTPHYLADEAAYGPLDAVTTVHALLPPRKIFADASSQKTRQGPVASGRGASVQFVSSSPPTRESAVELSEALQAALATRQAHDQGICPVKESVFPQVFDELIRQVTLDCPERGLILTRVRDELRMTLAAYRTVFESSIAFSAKKASESLSGLVDLEAEVGALEAEVAALQVKQCEQGSRADRAAADASARSSERQARFASEKAALRAQAESLRTFLQQFKPAPGRDAPQSNAGDGESA